MKFNFATAIARKSVVTVLLLACVSPLVTARAQQASLQANASREEVRRQQDVIIAQQLVEKADKATADKDYEAAYVNYLDALDKIPAGGVTEGFHAQVVVKFSNVGILYANQLVNDGHYADAERVAKTILLPQYNPTCKPAVQFLSNLEQSDYYNKTVTPQFAADREKVVKLLYEADGYFQSGRYDLAMKRYEQVLSIDRYNTAARNGMENVTKEKAKYYSSAYNETRSRMLWMVDAKWDRPVRRFDSVRSTTSEVVNRGIHGNEQIIAKLNRIIIPKIDLRDTTVREAVEFLKQQSKQLDNSTEDNKLKRGVNIVLKLGEPTAAPEGTAAVAPAPATPPDPTAPAAPIQTSGNADTSITLALTNVPLMEALRYLTELAHLKYKIEPYAVSIVPLSENTTDLVTKEYRVPPGFIPTSTPEAGAAGASPGAASVTGGGAKVGSRVPALEYLRDTCGVVFPPGGFAQYIPTGSRLIVRNTPDAIDSIDSLVDAVGSAQPTQVEIESKFLEITQNNLKELGFNWLLGPLQIGGGTYGAGGTQGFGTNTDPTSPSAANYSFSDSSGTPIGANPVTGGLRSGTGLGPNAGISANSIDALLGSVATGVAPAVFGVSGIFTNPQFQVVIRALNQKKGIDLMTAPKVTTKSGRKALVRVAREFPYPTEFNPPQPPPASTGSATATVVTPGTLISEGVVTPSTPTAFETRNLGVTLEVEPVIGPDNYTIDLNLSPEVVEFDGFVNYGSPILGPTIIATPPFIGTAVLTSNVINQPIFSTRKVTTSVSIWDGQTVALGGLVREDVQKVQDKVPLLGDIPIAGRLFRSDIDQKIKRNLIIFVTARLMDAEGRPVRQDEEIEEVVEPLGLPQDLPPPTINQTIFTK